jgi:hypothetical protein
MTTLEKHLVTYGLCAVVLFLILANWNQHKTDNINRANSESLLIHRLDSIREQLQTSSNKRDSLYSVIDSIDNLNKDLSLRIEQKDKEILSIKGRYKNVPTDSLGIMMDARAGKNNR